MFSETQEEPISAVLLPERLQHSLLPTEGSYAKPGQRGGIKGWSTVILMCTSKRQAMGLTAK